MMRNSIFYVLIVVLFTWACSSKTQKHEETSVKETETTAPKSENDGFSALAKSVFEIKTFDGDRILETGKGFMVTPSTIVAPFSLFERANRATISPLNGGADFEVSEFYNYDRINNLILLKTDEPGLEPLKLYGVDKVEGLKTIVVGKKTGNRLPLYSGSCLQKKTLQGRRLFSISNQIGKISSGTPVFVSNGAVLGMGISEEVMFERQYFTVPANEILSLVNKRDEARELANIQKANSVRNASIKQIVLETDYGNITIKLHNETPAYRDNFIKLAEEGFYDSLLIHRVISDFGIQTGAADTRHAASDDIVGWKGPGYTIPANIVDGLYHKRGAIGSPRKPDDKNNQRRSDGSQFYIVTGRLYSDEELDEFEEKNGIRFTAEQREVYKTVGGSPHLDGAYTVFGEVVSGLEVADRLSKFPVKGDFRPLTDIRLKRVRVEY
ncbi:MAG: peptidylprolyl isomerase [Prolixibacteraceae bacterium]|nr:peptidylprolyl isomerase [Prolixibacteraceae bacterium]MBN2649883.1 peptidylprolyl isomerase [Prolixibacteraceae bacterium]